MSRVNKTNKSYTKVESKYIYFLDDQELYSIFPYKLLGGADALAKVKTGWRQVRVATGDDISEMVPGNDINVQHHGGSWFVVDNSFPQEDSYPALISV